MVGLYLIGASCSKPEYASILSLTRSLCDPHGAQNTLNFACDHDASSYSQGRSDRSAQTISPLAVLTQNGCLNVVKKDYRLRQQQQQEQADLQMLGEHIGLVEGSLEFPSRVKKAEFRGALMASRRGDEGLLEQLLGLKTGMVESGLSR
ncbi:hypothetical protein NDU88_003238 [Pleurodeles waltl]|uniref:Uncharacterized protein n=1 Tax=Pleurodeles waltl TaxID=8319 RepID=A0AAV7NQD0_PLEWA|nr:hypothetical protein NDU88_003238 [Pleurodeles waltl]